ncbi:GAF domain-containing protein [Actinopolymorpha singaporensis]|uniref:GAF domain-containing protein n=1 Tax=Actinopolymorpha singaporensis TaxID=117157 RepID=A0A1H1T1T9_9ACTN|nr:GAF domain-containing protein [Actinopolymorpha singaporensis]SDS54192.1 GAF domain-containing protein [Actinopolymorpha singaporensis]
MQGTESEIDGFCAGCRSKANLPRYAGARVSRTQEIDQVVRGRLDRADPSTLDGFSHPPRCRRCGALLWERSADTRELPVEPPYDSNDPRRSVRPDILDREFLATADKHTLLGTLLDAALTHCGADAANAQLMDPNRKGLYIAAHRGFERPFLDYFEWVDGNGSACAVAAAERSAVIVPNVLRSPLFDDATRRVILDARISAVLSIPLLSSTRQLLGVFSCHYRAGRTLTGRVAPLLHVVAGAAAWSLQRHLP